MIFNDFCIKNQRSSEFFLVVVIYGVILFNLGKFNYLLLNKSLTISCTKLDSGSLFIQHWSMIRK